jgi:hypothetical protein
LTHTINGHGGKDNGAQALPPNSQVSTKPGQVQWRGSKG